MKSGICLPDWLMDKLKQLVDNASVKYELNAEQRSKLLFLLCTCEVKAITGRCYKECSHCTRNNTLYIEQYTTTSIIEKQAILYLITEEKKLEY